MLGSKYSGGSKWGNWGCIIGTLVGLLFLPWGVILGPFLGAVIGEVAYIRIYTTKKAAKPVIDCSLKPLKGLVIP